MRALLCFVCLICVPITSSANAARPPAADVVAKMQAFYNRATDLKGKFKQVYTDALYNRRRTSYGYLYVRKPGMMRWNYVKPERKSFIADGKVLWVWEPEDKQAFRNPLSTATLSSGLTFLLGRGKLSEEFDITYAPEKLGGPGDLVLKLTPKEPTPQYQHLLLVVKSDDFSVAESMVISKHSHNHFIFTKLKINTRLSRARFRFRPPPNTRIIDSSKLQQRPGSQHGP
jgi:outer membrane lipoprotein carrier protein